MGTRNNPKVLVLGGGAIGGFYGSKLAQGGANVSVVCRSNFEAVSTQGYTIKSPWGDSTFFPEGVFRRVEDYKDSPDYIFISLKALPELKIPAMIKDVVRAKTSIVLFQNGINIELEYLQAFPKIEIISGLAFVCVSQKKPGFIDHQDFGRVGIGRYPNGKSTKLYEFGELFNRANVACVISEDIITERWKKLIWNASFNPLSVLGGGRNTQEIMHCVDAVNLIRDLMQEVRTVAQSSGYEISQEVIRNHLTDTKAMQPYKTSMLLDYEAGKDLEIEAILGNLIKIAETKKLPTPYSKAMYNLLKLITLSK